MLMKNSKYYRFLTNQSENTAIFIVLTAVGGILLNLDKKYPLKWAKKQVLLCVNYLKYLRTRYKLYRILTKYIDFGTILTSHRK